MTKSENILHAYKLNLRVAKKGSESPFSKLNENKIIEIRNLSGKMKQKDIAVKFNISRRNINRPRTSLWRYKHCIRKRIKLLIT